MGLTLDEKAEVDEVWTQDSWIQTMPEDHQAKIAKNNLWPLTSLIDFHASGRISLASGPLDVLVADLSGFVVADQGVDIACLLQEADGAGLGEGFVADFSLG